MPKILDTNPDSESDRHHRVAIRFRIQIHGSESGFVSRIFGILKNIIASPTEVQKSHSLWLVCGSLFTEFINC